MSTLPMEARVKIDGAFAEDLQDSFFVAGPRQRFFLSRSAFSGGSRTWGLVIGSPAVF